MVVFEDIQDVVEWLDDLGYVELWEAVQPYRILGLADRDHCDGLISRGTVQQDLILSCLKGLVRMELTQRMGLRDRIHDPLAAESLHSTH